MTPHDRAVEAAHEVRHRLRGRTDAMIRAYLRVMAAEGWKLTPREVTKEQVLAGDDAKEECIDSDYDSDADGNRYSHTSIRSDLAARVWSAMHDAAPSPEEAS